VEDRGVLRHREIVRGAIEVCEVDVLGASVGVGQLRARDREARARLDERQHPALLRGDAGEGGLDGRNAAEVRRRVLPAQRA